MTVYWHVQGNSQEWNFGGSGINASYTHLYSASAPVTLSFVDHVTPGFRWPEYKAQKDDILASLVPGSLNVLSIRPNQIGDADMTSIYGDDLDAWEADVVAYLQSFLAQGVRICVVGAFLTGETNAKQRLMPMSNRMAAWVGVYCHGYADMRTDPIMTDIVGGFAAHPTEFQSDGHMKDPGQSLVYSYFQPAMDRVVRPSWFSRA